MSPQQREEVRKLLSDMLARNIISPSKSPWASPVVLVKKNGDSRFCVDYCQVNTVTRKDAFPCLGWTILWTYWQDQDCSAP